MLKESTRILRFMLIGSLNAIITASVVFIMMEVFDYEYRIANITAYITALINNYLWSKYWVFGTGKGSFRSEIPLFLLAFLAAYSAQFLFIHVLIEAWNMNEYVSQFLGLFIFGAVNFVMNRRITFRSQ